MRRSRRSRRSSAVVIPDLTDLLAGFSLAAVATATGLLTGGHALVCAWAAESVVMIGFGERLSRRGPRRLRALSAASVYLALAIGRTAFIVAPDQLPRLGGGSTGGVIALAAVAVAGIAVCYGLRHIGRPERVIAWLIPAAAIGYIPAWALPPEWAVVAYAGLAALLLVHRRTRLAMGWLRDARGSRSGSARAGRPSARPSARMERDGLVIVEGDRHLELTDQGRARATRSCASTASPSACSST